MKANDVLKKGPFVGSVLLFLSALALVAYYILGPAEGYFHSDSTDTIFWAQASFVSGRVFDPSFYYAAMLPFGGQLLMGIWIPFFGVSMTTQALGMLSFLAVLAAALLFFFRSWRFSWTGALFYGAVLLLLFSATDKLREMFWGHVIYYSLYVVFVLVGFGLLARLVGKEPVPTRKNVVTLAALFVFCFLVALDGLQIIFIFTVPLVAAVAGERWLDGSRKLFVRENLGTGILLLTVGVATLVGYITLKILQNGQIAGYASAWYGVTPMAEWLEHLFYVPEHWITLLGGGVPGAGNTTLEIAEILGSLGFALFLAFFPFVALCLYRKSRDTLFRAFVILHFMTAALILLACVFGSLGAANWRWIPVVATGLLLTILTLRTLAKEFRMVRVAFAVVPVLLVMAVLQGVEIGKMDADYGRDNNLHVVAAELESRGLEYGYADFWLAQAITVLTDSEVEVRSVHVDAADGITGYAYQSSSAWYLDQEGVETYFLVTTTWDYNQLRLSDAWDDLLDTFVSAEEINDVYVLVLFSENPF